ncbi:hypothetical protein [Microbacterium sp. LMI1x-1-1.1]|uniref:hypothetical protein n=1 Tax=Microbacterium sp. LMI1x-1-1.1 TaxID=3135246 RepID=UPI0034468CF1
MAVAITAVVSSAAVPAPVILVVTGVGAGVAYRIHGTTDQGFEWDVNGGSGVGYGNQITLGDILTPVNVPVTYMVTTSAGFSVAGAITVPGPEFLLQSLDGRTTVTVLAVTDGTFDREYSTRVSAFNIPGRARPVTRYDMVQDGTGSLTLATVGAQTKALEALLRPGWPLVYRQSGIRDLDPVDVVQFTAVKTASPDGPYRTWELTYQLLDHPQSAVAAVVASWDVFDQVYSGATWNSFDTEWASGTWDAFDAYDWTARV